MILKVTRAKPFVNPFRDYKGEIYKRLVDNELVCSRESAQIRKYVYVFIPESKFATPCISTILLEVDGVKLPKSKSSANEVALDLVEFAVICVIL